MTYALPGFSYLAFSALVLLVKQMPYWFRMSLPGTSKVNKMEFLTQLPTMLSSIKSKTVSKLEAPLQARVPSTGGGASDGIVSFFSMFRDVRDHVQRCP
jgi:hypothetical protein